MFDNHIWGVTADNESISANLFISGFFKSLMLVSASAPKTAYQLCKLLQLGFLIVLCSRTLNLLKPRKQSLHHSCRFRHLMWCWSNVLLLFCHRRFVSSHVNSLARLQNYPKTRIGIVTEMLAHVSSSFFFFFFLDRADCEHFKYSFWIDEGESHGETSSTESYMGVPALLICLLQGTVHIN